MTLLTEPQLSLIKTLLPLAALLTLPGYLLVPVQLRFRGWPATDTEVELADGDDVPPGVGTAFDPWVSSLEVAGFAAHPLCRGVVPSPQGAGQVWYVRLLEHHDGRDLATMLTPAARALPSRPTSVLVFETRLAGGGTVRTTNSSLPSSTPTAAGDSAARFPRVRDAARLYALHRAHLRRLGSPGQSRRIGDPVVFQRRQEALSRERMIASGWFEEAGGEMRRTWRGAFLGTWRHLLPWRAVLASRDARLLRELEAALDAA